MSLHIGLFLGHEGSKGNRPISTNRKKSFETSFFSSKGFESTCQTQMFYRKTKRVSSLKSAVITSRSFDLCSIFVGKCIGGPPVILPRLKIQVVEVTLWSNHRPKHFRLQSNTSPTTPPKERHESSFDLINIGLRPTLLLSFNFVMRFLSNQFPSRLPLTLLS